MMLDTTHQSLVDIGEAATRKLRTLHSRELAEHYNIPTSPIGLPFGALYYDLDLGALKMVTKDIFTGIMYPPVIGRPHYIDWK